MTKKRVLAIDREGIQSSLRGVLGDQIRRPRIMRLGNPLTGEVKVSLDDADAPGRVFVHGIGGENLSNSEDDDENKQTVSQALLPPGKISDDLLVYGTPVEVVRRGGQLRVVDFEPSSANEHLFELKTRPQTSIVVSQFDYGLIRPTSPVSMRVLVTNARYTLDRQAYAVPTRQSTSLASYKPANSGMAVAVQITIDPVTAALSYEAGEGFSDTLSHEAAFGFYPAEVADDHFLCGWIKIKASQTSISISDIYHAPELLNKSSAGSILNHALIDDDGNIVVDDDGNIVLDE